MSQGLNVGEWFGDDHSRLVLFEQAMQDDEGASQAGFVEFAWDRSETDAIVLAPPAFQAMSVRNTDIGFCSLSQTWTQPDPVPSDIPMAPSSPAGCGLLDQVSWGFVRAFIEGVDDQTFYEDFFTDADATLVSGPFARTRFNLTNPFITDDSFCVEADFRLQAVLLVFIGPEGECLFERVRVGFCGRFVMVDNGDGTRDAEFLVRDAVVRLGSRGTSPNPLTICYPFMRNMVRDGIRDALQSDLPTQLATTFNDSLWQREVASPFAPYPVGQCSQAQSGFTPLAESLCAAGATQDERDAMCREFVLGASDSPLPVRAVCEQRTNFNPAGKLVLDEQPVCYWNVEADRVEMLPSRLEVVLAHDAGDVTVQAIDTVLGRVEPIPGMEVGLETFCRVGELEPFMEEGNATGTLGPFTPTDRLQ